MTYASQNIRNVVLLGHSGSGKTTFAEAMLYETKAINRRGNISDGTTSSDYTNIEKERKNSLFSTLLHAYWKDSKINILDTPGSDDFVGEVISSMKVADTALMILNAKGGVEVGTELLWEYVERFQTPALFIVNHLDNDKADYDTTIEQAKQRFGTKVIPFQFPIRQGVGFNAIVDCLRMVTYVFNDEGGKPIKEDIADEHIERAKAIHNQLVEAAAENDDTLMEKYFENGTLSEEELSKGLRIAMVNQEIFPIFIASADRNMGSGRIMGFINDICPSPADRPPALLTNGDTIAPQAGEPDTVFVYKTLSEPKVGMLSYFKVYGGKIESGQELFNPRSQHTERLSQLYISNGKERTAVHTLLAGDIGICVKLKDTKTNDTLSPKPVAHQIEPIHFPNARVRRAIVPPNRNEMEKVIKALHQIQTEDPTLHVELSKALKQTLLHGQGELHLELIRYRIEKVNNLHIEYTQPKIEYRETITKAVSGSYRHKKQSGGSGQFAEIHMQVEPYKTDAPLSEKFNVKKEEIVDLPWGGKLSFVWCIVGGSIDAKYSNAIKKGILQKMEEGPLVGAYCQNVRVYIYDGKMHPVDSNDMAFMLAAGHLFKDCFLKAAPKLLEPIYTLEILCADESTGDIMSDLQSRRAMITGMGSDGHYQKISATVPLSELYQYSSSIRSMTQGKAKFSRDFSTFQAVPYELQNNLVARQQSMEESS